MINKVWGKSSSEKPQLDAGDISLAVSEARLKLLSNNM